MNATRFVDAIQAEVRDAAARDVISLIERPPGRRPSPDLTSLSQWFNALSESDRRHVKSVALLASNLATFGFLAVLDGARIIEEPSDRGALELRYIKPGEKTVLLNDPEGEVLHELLRQPQ
jgi:hypothetical protein